MTTAAVPEVLEAEVPAGGALASIGGVELDVQITTAKRFPRSIATFKKVALEMACLDEETAEACFYALPRGGKTIEGPSARLAEICMTAWGNSRVEAKKVGEDERFVTARGTAWDLQTNVAVAFEVTRRITTSAKKGESKKFDDDMVGVTSNAAASIALRNAVFKMIPAAFWKPIYVACRHAAVGDIKTLANRRAIMLDHFQKLGVRNEQVFAMLDVKGVEDMTLDHLATLKGLSTALKDGETTVEEAFAAAAPIKPAERKSEQQAKESAPDTAQTTEPAKTEAPAAQTTNSAPAAVVDKPAVMTVGTIESVEQSGQSSIVILNTGFRCSTKDAALIASAKTLMADKRVVDLTTTPSPRDPSKYMARLDEILPVAAE